MAENIKHLCAPIPEALHTKLRRAARKIWEEPKPIHDLADHTIL